MDKKLKKLVKKIEQDETGISVMNPARAKSVHDVFENLKKCTKGKGVRVSYELNKPFTSMGSVTVSGNEVVFDNTELFVKSAVAADNFEIYPKTNGTVEMNFTFHNLTKKIGDLENG